MSSSILEQYWIQQKKQRPLFSSSRSNIRPINEGFNHMAIRSDIFSSASYYRTDFQPNSTNLSSTLSTTKLTMKEFCPKEKEEDEEEKFSSRRFVYH
jgi:hypothetical protein